jgi:uncharacterized membrane protein
MGWLKEAIMLKTLSFAAVHFTVAFTVGYLLTGSVLVGGTMALVEPACNTIAYYFHEKVWARAAIRQRIVPQHPVNAYSAAQ